MKDELVEQHIANFARARGLSSPVEEAPADVAERSDRLMQEFYLSRGYDPKAERPADTVKAAIAFTITRLSADLADARKVIEQIKDTVQYVDNPYAKDAYWLARQWLSQQGDQS